jgi:hypothetical protein
VAVTYTSTHPAAFIGDELVPISATCKGKTLLELEETHSGNGKDQGIAKGC